MVDLIDRALRLWSDPVPVGDKGLASFRTVYTDPVRVNGVPTALVELVERARMLQRALIPLSHEVYAQVDAPGRCAFVFRLSGCHVVGDVRQGYVRFEDRLRHHPAAPDRARLWVHDRLGDSPPLSCPRRAPQPHRSDTENKAVLSTEPMPR